jgi:tetratricopeptide (TPR) repeat protein
MERALAVFESLLAESPDDAVRQRDVALAEKYLGAYDESGHDYASALRHHLRAADLDERRRTRNPGDRVAQFDAAIDLSNIGYAHSQAGNPAKGAEFYEKSLAIRESLAAGDPKDVLARSKVAFVHRQLGWVYRDAGRLDEALAHSRQALAIYDSLESSDAYHRMELSETLQVLGGLEQASGRRPAACAAYGRALTSLRTVPEADRRARHGGTDPLTKLEQDAAGCPATPVR